MATQWTVERLDPAELTEADARAMVELSLVVWPRKDASVAAEAAKMMWDQQEGKFLRTRAAWFVVREGARLLAKSGTFAREIGTSRGPITIMALEGVGARPEYRGRGLGAAVVRASFARVDAGEFAFSLFQTCRNNRPFYERLGAETISNRIVNSRGANPEQNPLWDELAMRYPAPGEWPEGTIDLRGPAW